MKLALFMCLYKRHDLEEIVLDYYTSLQKEFDFDIVVAGSEGEITEKLAHGCKYYELPNEPVSDKHNALLQKVKRYSGVILIGSDDLIDKKTFAKYWGYSKDLDYVPGFQDVYFYRTFDGKFTYWNGRSMGAGRFYSKKILQKMDYTLWPEGINKGLDNGSWGNLRKAKIELRNISLKDIDGYIVDVKHKQNISSHAIVDCGTDEDKSVLIKRFPEEVITKISRLSGAFEINKEEDKYVTFYSNGTCHFLTSPSYRLTRYQAEDYIKKGYGYVL